MAIAESNERRTLTIQIPADLADALEPLDGTLIADDTEITSLLRDALYSIHEQLGKIADDASDLPVEDLRELSRRLATVVAAAEAVA